MSNEDFNVDELELDDLSVTSIRDSAALPETGASSGSSSSSASSCCGSSSCCSSCGDSPEEAA
ncbi:MULTISPECIES: thiazolylpeptide-type bacteriocin [Catellatospora]|jgi:thiazolylpeptide-type bacteriocin precursor|uniref:thiazolylpeptide-type bacteriocin n=1 Tax=Catellatospora TaxID=53365 RepID=UPI0019423AC6|nr:thiazolylpeptide-type bacteriocin [Catellatospora coxensis]